MSWRGRKQREFVVRTSAPDGSGRRNSIGVRYEVVRTRWAREALARADGSHGRQADWVVGTVDEAHVREMIETGEIELSENGGGR